LHYSAVSVPGVRYEAGFGRLDYWRPGDLLIRPRYFDECGNVWLPPVDYVSVTAESPSVSVSKEGDHEVLNTSHANYTIEVEVSGASSCPSPRLVVTDRLPPFLQLDYADPYPNSTAGGVLTWEFSSPRSLNISLGVTCPTGSCGDWGKNSVNATLECCGACSPSSSADFSIRLTCSETGDCFWLRTRTNVSSVEVCGVLEYESTVHFSVDGVNSTTSNMVYSHCALETGRLQEELVGSAEVILPNGTTVSLSPFEEGEYCIKWNISSLNFVANSGDEIEIKYAMRVKCSAGGYVHDRTGFSMEAANWAGVPLNCSGEYRWAAYVPVGRPGLSISEDPPPFTNVCREYVRRVRVTGASPDSPGYNLTVVSELPTGFSFSGTSNITFDNGTVLTGVTPYVEGSYLKWNRTNVPRFRKVDSDFTISFRVTPCCGVSPGFHYRSTLTYSDRCEAVGACEPGCDCVRTSSYDSGPRMILRPDVTVMKTPERVYALENVVEWTLHVANKGNGTAEWVEVRDYLGPGMVYEGSDLPPGWNVSVSPDGRNVTMRYEGMGDGEYADLKLRAKMVACSGLTNEVEAVWGCCSEECQVSRDEADVVIPEASLDAADWVRPSPVDLCGGVNVTAILKNVGKVHVYNATVNYSLPACFYYNSSVQAYAYNSTLRIPISPASSAPDGSWVVWNLTGTPFSDLGSGQYVNLTFNATASCPCVVGGGGGYSEMRVAYDKQCGEPAPIRTHRGVSPYSITSPDLELEAPTRVCGEPGDVVDWNISAVNGGGATAEFVNITVEIPSSSSLVSATPPPDSVSGRTLRWITSRAGGSVPDIPPGGRFDISLRVSVDECVYRGYLRVNLRDGCPGCIYENEWYNRTTYLHSQPSRVGLGISDLIEACRNATWRIDVRNRDSCLPLWTAESDVPGVGTRANYTVTDTLADGIDPVEPLASNSQVFYVGPAGSTEIPVYDYGTAPPPGTSEFAWVRRYGTGLEWMIFTTNRSLPPGHYFRILYNVTTSDCGLIRRPHTVSTHNLMDRCWVTRDGSVTRSFRVRLPDLEVEKTPEKQYADLGAQVSWTVTVRNSGNGTADNVTVKDVLAPGLTYLWADPAPDLVNSTGLYWTNITLGPGESFSYDLGANVSHCPPPNLTNTVEAYWGCGSVCVSEPANATALILACGAAAPIEKTPLSFDVCGNHTITITIHNRGATMYGVAVNDTIPLGLEPMDVTPDGNVTATFTVSGGAPFTAVSNLTRGVPGSNTTIVWNLTNLVVPGGADLTVSFRVHANCSLSSSREVLNLTYWDACNNSYGNLTFFSVTPKRPDLSNSEKVKVSPAGRLDRWDRVTWDIVIKNDGDGRLYFLNVTDRLGPGLEYAGANVTPTSVSGRNVTWAFDLSSDPLEPGEEMTIRLWADAEGCADPYRDEATLEWGCDGEVCGTVSLTSEVPRARPDIEVDDLFDGNASVCVERSFSFKVSNGGDGRAYGFNSSYPVVLGYELPSADCMEYSNGSSRVTLPNGTVLRVEPSVNGSSGRLNLTWTLTGVTVEPGDEIRVSFNATPLCCIRAGGETSAYASWYDACGELQKDSDSERLERVYVPRLSVEKSPPSQRVDRWDSVGWTIVVRNDGNGTAWGVNVTDVMDGLTYLGDNQSSKRTGSGDHWVSWLVDIPPGEKFAVSLTANMTGCPPTSDNVTASWGCQGVCQSPTDEAEVLMLYPNVSVEKLPENGSCPLSLEPGDEVNFTIRVRNSGDGTAYDLNLTDRLPDFLEYVGSDGDYDPSTHSVRWRIQKLEDERNLTLRVRVAALTPDGTNGTNVVYLKYEDACGNEENPETGARYEDEDSCDVHVRAPVWSVEKSVTPSIAKECDLVTVTVRAENVGHGHMYHANVSDRLPPGLAYEKGSCVVRNSSTGEVISTSDPRVKGQRLTWPLDLTLNPGEGVVITFRARVRCGAGSSDDYAEAVGMDGGGGVLREGARAHLDAVSSRVTLSKTLSRSIVESGGEVRVYITVINTGNGTARDIRIEDKLPEGASYVRGSSRLGGQPISDPHISGGRLSWNIGTDLRPGQSTTLEFKMRVSGVGEKEDVAEAFWS
ncbi:MAG: hypothetical protein DRO06_01030, partial [Thermoproteota archaeon]